VDNALRKKHKKVLKKSDSLTSENKLSLWHGLTIGAISIITIIVAYLIKAQRNDGSKDNKNEITLDWLIFLHNKLLALEEAYKTQEQISFETLLYQFRLDIKKLACILNFTSSESEKELLRRFAKLYLKETHPLFSELQLSLFELLELEFIPYTHFSDFAIKAANKLHETIDRG
jgi:hypothetical protein